MNTPPKIAVMLPRFSRYGGVERFGYRLAEGLAAKGLAVDFICARQEDVPPPGVNVISVGRAGGFKVFKMFWFLFRAERMRKRGGYDVTLSLGKTWNQDIARIGGGPLQTFWRLSKEAWPAGLPRFFKQCARRLDPANWLTLLVERRMFHKTPHIVAISDSLRGWITEVYPHLAHSSEQEMTTVYNCPDVSRFHPPAPEERRAARAHFNVRDGNFAVGLATTNFTLKGVAHLIRALTLLPEDTHLHIAGGRSPRRYKELAASLHLADRVHFHGRVEDMRVFYHSLDMFVLPSFYDTLGNVVLEALGSGLKTLCSNRAGACSFLPSDQVIEDPADSEEIAMKIYMLREKTAPVLFEPKGAGIEDLAALVEVVLARKRTTTAAGRRDTSVLL